MSLVQAVFQGLGLTHGQAQPRHNLGRLDDESAIRIRHGVLDYEKYKQNQKEHEEKE